MRLPLNGGPLLDHLSGPLATDLDDSARVVEELPSEKVDRSPSRGPADHRGESLVDQDQREPLISASIFWAAVAVLRVDRGAAFDASKFSEPS